MKTHFQFAIALLLSAFQLFSFSAFCTPVQINVADTLGSPINAVVILKPAQMVGITYPNYTLGANVSIQATNGMALADVAEGPYFIAFLGYTASRKIFVPGLWATNAGITLPVNLGDARWQLGLNNTTVLVTSTNTGLPLAAGTNATVYTLNGFNFVSADVSHSEVMKVAQSVVATNISPGGGSITNFPYSVITLGNSQTATTLVSSATCYAMFLTNIGFNVITNSAWPGYGDQAVIGRFVGGNIAGNNYGVGCKPVWPITTGQRAALVFWGGANNVNGSNIYQSYLTSPAAVTNNCSTGYSNTIADYCLVGQGAGCDVFAITCPVNFNHTSEPFYFIARDFYNSFIRSAVTNLNLRGFIDIDTIIPPTVLTNPALPGYSASVGYNTNYLPDGIHPSAMVNSNLAVAVAAMLKASMTNVSFQANTLDGQMWMPHIMANPIIAGQPIGGINTYQPRLLFTGGEYTPDMATSLDQCASIFADTRGDTAWNSSIMTGLNFVSPRDDWAGLPYAHGVRFYNHAQTTCTLNVDTTDNRVGVGLAANAAPQYKLDVGGDINLTGTLRTNGVPVVFGGSGTNGGGGAPSINYSVIAIGNAQSGLTTSSPGTCYPTLLAGMGFNLLTNVASPSTPDLNICGKFVGGNVGGNNYGAGCKPYWPITTGGRAALVCWGGIDSVTGSNVYTSYLTSPAAVTNNLSTGYSNNILNFVLTGQGAGCDTFLITCPVDFQHASEPFYYVARDLYNSFIRSAVTNLNLRGYIDIDTIIPPTVLTNPLLPGYSASVGYNTNYLPDGINPSAMVNSNIATAVAALLRGSMTNLAFQANNVDGQIWFPRVNSELIVAGKTIGGLRNPNFPQIVLTGGDFSPDVDYSLANCSTIFADTYGVTAFNPSIMCGLNFVSPRDDWAGNPYAHGIRFYNHAKTTCTANIDTTDNRVGLGLAANVAPAYTLDVGGDINLTGTLRTNGVPVTFGGGGTGGLYQPTNNNLTILASNNGSALTNTGTMGATTNTLASLRDAAAIANAAIIAAGTSITITTTNVWQPSTTINYPLTWDSYGQFKLSHISPALTGDPNSDACGFPIQNNPVTSSFLPVPVAGKVLGTNLVVSATIYTTNNTGGKFDMNFLLIFPGSSTNAVYFSNAYGNTYGDFFTAPAGKGVQTYTWTNALNAYNNSQNIQGGYQCFNPLPASYSITNATQFQIASLIQSTNSAQIWVLDLNVSFQ